MFTKNEKTGAEKAYSKGNVKSNMLYDLKHDPKENENISMKEENRELVKELSQLLSKVKQSKN